MADWSIEEWKAALSARGTENETEAYQRLGRYLLRIAKGYLDKKLVLHLYLQRQSDADVHDLAGQLVQQALEKVFVHYGDFEWRSHVKTWAAAILIREIKQLLRRSQIREEVLVSYTFSSAEDDEPIDPFEYAVLTEHMQAKQTPEVKLVRREFRRDLEAVLDRLSDKQRYAFVECCLRERPVADVARELTTSIGAVYQLVSRARRKLQTHLRDLGYESGFDQ